jgi:hypothetical protein
MDKLEVIFLINIKGGKTFTMGTSINTLSNDNQMGIVPRVIQ